MKTHPIIKTKAWVAVVLLILATNTAMGRAPKVIKTIPETGAQDVDPNLREMRIVFDQDMRRDRYSICGGDNSPKVIGKPRWVNKRTVIAKVKLVPNHNYQLSINCRSYKNFKNVRGEPAVPYPIQFRTGSGTSDGQDETVSVADNKEAIRELRRAIEENYSYYKLRKVDWDDLFSKYGPRMRRAKTAHKFAQNAANLLAHAKDLHVWVKIDGESIGGFQRNIARNYNRRVLENIVPNWQKRSAAVYTGQFADGIGYILIDSWSRERAEALEQAYVAIWELSEASGLIIDIRPNSGGAEPLARQFAGCFVDKPVMYAKHVYRSVDQPGGFGKVQKRMLQPNRRRPKYRGKVAVLTGAANMSSCEAFLLMMKQVPGCKLVGDRSYGSSGNPKPTDLGNGVTVWLPSWKALRPDGTCFESQGIKPDILVEATESQLRKDDPVLEIALKLLRKP